MSIDAVIGGQWGDEGKGKIVDLLSKNVEIVARYQGGANAGHTVYKNNQKIVKIFGKISNISNTEIFKIPKLQATLFDNNENVITTWFFYAEQENLDPQESINFNTSYIHEDSQNIADIKIEFNKKVE